MSKDATIENWAKVKCEWRVCTDYLDSCASVEFAQITYTLVQVASLLRLLTLEN